MMILYSLYVMYVMYVGTYVCTSSIGGVCIKSEVRFRGVLEVRTLDYSNSVCQESFKSELELEVFWKVCVHTWSKVTGQK